jgi:hypothetical protein
MLSVAYFLKFGSMLRKRTDLDSFLMDINTSPGRAQAKSLDGAGVGNMWWLWCLVPEHH